MCKYDKEKTKNVRIFPSPYVKKDVYCRKFFDEVENEFAQLVHPFYRILKFIGDIHF